MADYVLVPAEATIGLPESIRGLRQMADSLREEQPSVARVLETAANAFAALLFHPGGKPVDPASDAATVELWARTIYEAGAGRVAYVPWDDLTDGSREWYGDQARAVLALGRSKP